MLALRRFTSIASRTNVRDDREAPLLWDGMAESIKLFLPNREAKYFCGQGWTGNHRARSLICPSGRSPFAPSIFELKASRLTD
jgi:hypothetical protein